MTTLQQIYHLMSQLSADELAELQARLTRRQQLQQQVQATGERILGLHTGQIQMREGFIQPLDDELWDWDKR
jgi:uncharacterized protein (DUF2342 family)